MRHAACVVAFKGRDGEFLKAFGAGENSGSSEKEPEGVTKDPAEPRTVWQVDEEGLAVMLSEAKHPCICLKRNAEVLRCAQDDRYRSRFSSAF